ncbi:amino acid ABC transporter ATP-binding protein [Caballeronia peredens]|nr:amino acid ABC transporter ATP-binding protein [Caballeronia peredens]
MIELKNVIKAYDPSNPVLRGVSTTIRKGDVVAVLGGSGSGKSTMLKTLNALEPIQGGAIKVLGKDIKAWDERELRKKVGMVFQDFGLFANKTALENLVLTQTIVRGTPRKEAQARALSLLYNVNMQEHAHKFPHELSGGQQQRVAIARALANEPEIILFDEPTSALDPEMTREVLCVMNELADSGITMVVVTHSMWFAENVSNHVLFMADGKIVEDRPTADFFREPKTEKAKNFLNIVKV